MIEYFIDIIISFKPMFSYVIGFVFALCFVATVPCLIRNIISWR